MRRSTIILFFLFSLTPVFGQNKDTLNKLNSKGKKNGYWVQYLDSLGYPTDSSHSYFYGYDLYDNGAKVFRFADRNKLWRKYKLVFDGHFPEKGKPIPIEGTFKWYRGKAQLVNEETYKNGRPFFWKSFNYYKTDSINSSFNEVLYFDILYNNMPGTFLYEEYCDGKLCRKYWFRKGKRGWRSYRIKEK